MAKQRKARGKVGRPKGSGVLGHVTVPLQLREDQRDALVELAEARREPGKRPPVSEVARELLDSALRKKPPAAE
jgi:hypothetical protein